MGIIHTKFDNSLKQSEIRVPLTFSSKDEAQEAYVKNQSEIQQTLVNGIQAPLIMINNIVINFYDVISFELRCESYMPEIDITVQDRYQLITMIDSPSIDNELRVQILPKFENKYKKINLTFYITQMNNNDGNIKISGTYKSPKFISSNIKSFGETSVYKLFEKIATETQLGFATNVEDDSNNRYMYCDNKSYNDLLRNEISRSCMETKIYDYWIDWWNNLVLVDIYERYNATDNNEDMKIWISGQNKEVSEGSEIEPIETIASLHNHPAQRDTELYFVDYKILTSPSGHIFNGTDRVFSIYEFPKTEYMDYLIQDGDVKKDIFTKYEYLGEVYDDHNYLLAAKKYESFKQKIDSNETIEVSLKTPLLGIMRGNRVNFTRYFNNDMVNNIQNTLKEENCINPSPETNIPIPQDSNLGEGYGDGYFEIDRSVSGQYLITKCIMKFNDGEWKYEITLSRPNSMKPNIINEDNE